MELEFLDIDRRNAWTRVFQEIRNESNNYRHASKAARKAENKNLNRYRDVNPFDHTRVKLQRSDNDYINASIVKVPAADRSYILTQGPLPVTTGHFWLMVWEQRSLAILMLNRIIEKNAVKCHQYWPIGSEYGGEDYITLEDVNLEVTFLSQKEESHFVLREFLLLDMETEEQRTVWQFHYTTWPDFGVPESPSAFLDFLFSVRNSGALNSNVGPPVVHCSAGIGRSGTFCLVDSCLVLIEKSGDLNSINVRQCLLDMRHYRMGLIQTPDQLRFSYMAIIEGAKKILPQQGSLNVPLTNESSLQEANQTRLPGNQNTIMSDEENELNNSPPPPLPPRSSRNSDDLSPTSFKLFSVECNGDSNLSGLAIIESKHPKQEPGVSSAQNQESSNLEANEASVKQPLSEEACSKSGAHTSPAESLSEMRKRARKEREEKTASIVQNIKKKQKEAEVWEKRRSKRKRRE